MKSLFLKGVARVQIPRDNAYDMVWYQIFTEKSKKEQDRRVFKTAAA